MADDHDQKPVIGVDVGAEPESGRNGAGVRRGGRAGFGGSVGVASAGRGFATSSGGGAGSGRSFGGPGGAGGYEPPRYQGSLPVSAAEMGRHIIRGANELGADPVDFGTVISYKTIGTFSTSIKGGKGGRYEGLIQFGPPERRQYGAYRGQPFGDQIDAAVRYLKHRGFKPGMGLADLYSTINAGRPGLYNRSDRPGYTVARHAREMARSRHRSKARAIVEAGRKSLSVHKGEPPSPNQPQPVYPEGSPLRKESTAPAATQAAPAEAKAPSPAKQSAGQEEAKRPAAEQKASQLYLPVPVVKFRVVTMPYEADLHASRGMIRRVQVVEIKDGGEQQMAWVKGLESEEFKNAYRSQGFGLSTVPPEGSEGIALAIGGRMDQMLIIDTEHPEHRPKDMKPGDTVLYDAYGNTIKMEEEGVTHSNTKHIFNGPVEINGSVTINGDSEMNGNIEHDGNMTTSGVHTDSNGPHTA